MNVLDLFAKLTLDKSEYDEGLDESSEKASSFASKIGAGLKTAGKVGAVAIGAIGTAATAVTTSMIKGAGEVASYGDNIDKMSQKMGLTAEAYQEWDAVLQHSGTSIESMQASMKTLANAVETGNEAFEKLGLSQEQLAEMSQQDIFEATIAALQEVEDDTERTYLAGKLLGRGATELGALLNTSAEDTEKMRQRVHELGGVMSDEAVKASAQFQDNMQDLQTAFGGIKNKIMSDMLPSLNNLTEGFTKLLAGEEGADEQIGEGIDLLVTNITEGFGRVVEVGSTILPSIVESIINNLPQLFTVGEELLSTIVDAVTTYAPSLLSAGLEIIQTLITGITESLPDLVNSAVDIIKSLADFLVENVDTLTTAAIDLVFAIVDALTDPDTLVTLIEAAVEIIIALAEGLVNAVPKLIEKAPVIVGNLVTAIIKAAPRLASAALELIGTLVRGIVEGFAKIFEVGGKVISKFGEGVTKKFNDLRNWGRDIIEQVKAGLTKKLEDAKNWGKDLITNFTDGIKAKWDSLKSTLSETGDKIKSFLGFSEPEQGPLSDFHTYAPDMMDLFIKGIKDNEAMLQRAVADAFDFENLIEAPTANLQVAGAGGGTVNINMNIYGAEGQDVNELAELVSQKLGAEVKRRTSSW
jgi:hypothetical protein